MFAYILPIFQTVGVLTQLANRIVKSEAILGLAMTGFALVPGDENSPEAGSSHFCEASARIVIPTTTVSTSSNSPSWWKPYRLPLCLLLPLVCVVALSNYPKRRDSSPEEDQVDASAAILLQAVGNCPAECGQSVACRPDASKPIIPARNCPRLIPGGPAEGQTTVLLNLGDCDFNPGDFFNTTWVVNVFQPPGLYDYEAQVFGAVFQTFIIADGVLQFLSVPAQLQAQIKVRTSGSLDDPKLQIISLAFVNDTFLFFVNSADPGPMFSLQLLDTQGVNDARRLAEDFFTCSNGCVIPSVYVNDDFCDCPETCNDEDLWTCNTCAAGPPTTTPVQEASQAGPPEHTVSRSHGHLTSTRIACHVCPSYPVAL